MKRLTSFYKYSHLNKLVLNISRQIPITKKRQHRPLEAILSISILAIFLVSLINFFNWILFHAEWNVVTGNIRLYAFGSFPQLYLWRPILWILLIIITSLLSIFSNRKSQIYNSLILAWILIVPIGIFLLAGGLILEPVASMYWGGFILTLLLTLSSGLIAFPIGILLALGRQSEMPAINKISRIYIDIIRGLPLITVLFFGQLLIPLFLPMDFEINRIIRAVIAFAIFTAAYIAEDIRGGMQSIPTTQKEAAVVLGLDKSQTNILILLPQALKTAIPALTNQAIGLLQNTSLMAILGLVELLGISRSLLANPAFIGKYLEVYVWLGLIYWLACTCIALIARSIEQKMQPTNLNAK